MKVVELELVDGSVVVLPYTSVVCLTKDGEDVWADLVTGRRLALRPSLPPSLAGSDLPVLGYYSYLLWPH